MPTTTAKQWPDHDSHEDLSKILDTAQLSDQSGRGLGGAGEPVMGPGNGCLLRLFVVDPDGVLGDYSGMGRAGIAEDAATGQFTGLLIGLVFGLVFVEVNSGDLPYDWSFGLRAAGVMIGVMLFAGLLWRRRSLDRAEQTTDLFNRRYWVVVAVEVVALLAGMVIINRVLDADRFIVAWIAVVVGVHFFGLGPVWRDRMLYVVGAVLALLGLAGFLIGAGGGSAAAIALVSGVGSGAALFLGVGVALLGRLAFVNR